MVGATRPGRVLLIFAAVTACHVAVGGAIWYACLPAPVSDDLNEEILTELPVASFSETAENELPDPPMSLPTIDPQRPEAELLPTPPPVKDVPVYLGEDLERVPELKLEAPPAEDAARIMTTQQWVSHKARTSAAALALNGKEEDGFVKALLRTRPDLSGLPFLMGKACRTPRDRAAAFKVLAGKAQRGEDADFLANETASFSEEKLRLYRQAHVALLAQIQPTEKTFINWVRQLDSLELSDQPEATHELARIAVFSPDKTARTFALDALAKRAPCDSTEILVAGLRYPWPAVAENAARVIVKLKRKDLIPQLEATLDEADPRGPKVEADGEREVTVAREVVRINHHRNCMLCHAPAVEGKTPEEALTAEIPLPSEPLPSSGGYGGMVRPQHGLLVRIDLTYLRQDFSAVQKVSDSSAWPVRQRFDFLVRKRVLTPAEARDLRERLKGPSPYHAAAAKALRQLRRS